MSKWTRAELNRPAAVPVKPWKAPRLAREGKPFEPSGHEPGAFVGIRQGGTYAIGQVWSASPGGVWVVIEDELAPGGTRAVEVCVRPGCKRGGGLCRARLLAHLEEGA